MDNPEKFMNKPEDNFQINKNMVSHNDYIGHFINGKNELCDGPVRDIYDPSTGDVARQVKLARKLIVDKTIQAAEIAFLKWKNTTPIKRARIMFEYKGLLESNSNFICELIGQEHGKISHDALGELQRAIENVEYACAAPEILKGAFTRNAGTNVDSWSEFHPIGIVAGITPFNFPVMVPMWMIPLAVVCGNTFILKPSEKDPTATLFICQLLHEAGLPDGVLNVINGDKETVDLLLRDHRIQAISFVGSTPVAKSIYEAACSHGKRCQALGGAKNHAVIAPDADLDDAVDQLMGAAFGSSGERCMALSVVIVIGGKTADTLVEKLKSKMKYLKVGPHHNTDNNFGPLISKQHKEYVLSQIQSAVNDGASIPVDGRHVQVSGYKNGFFIGATLLDDVETDMESYQNEIFGPVLQIIRANSVDDAIEIINSNAYGNGTCIFTQNGALGRYFSNNVNIGMVGINTPLPVPISYHSFGGWKASLFGDLCAYGPDGVRFYTKRKTITQRWQVELGKAGSHFSMPSSG